MTRHWLQHFDLNYFEGAYQFPFAFLGLFSSLSSLEEALRLPAVRGEEPCVPALRPLPPCCSKQCTLWLCLLMHRSLCVPKMSPVSSIKLLTSKLILSPVDDTLVFSVVTRICVSMLKVCLSTVCNCLSHLLFCLSLLSSDLFPNCHNRRCPSWIFLSYAIFQEICQHLNYIKTTFISFAFFHVLDIILSYHNALLEFTQIHVGGDIA